MGLVAPVTGARAADAEFSSPSLRGDDGQLGHHRAVNGYHLNVGLHCTNPGSQGGGGGCKPAFGPFIVRFPSFTGGTVDLLKAVTRGTLLRQAQLDVNLNGSTCGATLFTCMTYCLYDAKVTNVTHDGGDIPETASFSFNRIGFIYRDQGDGGTQQFATGWDISRGASFTPTAC
jgi:type VI protein secretion system component Hcp